MSTIKFTEKRRLEQLLQMGGGYVLNFSDKTMREFFIDSVGLDISDEKYRFNSGSKANRMRAFWDKEPDHVVGKLLQDLIEYCRDLGLENSTNFEEMERVARRLLDSAPVQDIHAITPTTTDKSFELLAKQVREAIEKNQPEVGLDRLHAFVTKFMRVICEQRGLEIANDKPLHSLLGAYAKYLKTNNLLEAEMSERILKSSISVLEAFNEVRNNQSLAHQTK